MAADEQTAPIADSQEYAFISYSTPNLSIAVELREHLESVGIGCWFAPRDVAPATDYSVEIVEAIEKSTAMVLLFSSASDHSPHVSREVHLAADRGLRLLPLRIERVEPRGLRYFLSNVQWIEATGADRAAAYREVSRVLREETSGHRPPAPFGRRAGARALDALLALLLAVACAFAICGPCLGSPWLPWGWRWPVIAVTVLASAALGAWAMVRSSRRLEVRIGPAIAAYLVGIAAGIGLWRADDELIVRRTMDVKLARNLLDVEVPADGGWPAHLMPVSGALCLYRIGEQAWMDTLVPPLHWMSKATLDYVRNLTNSETVSFQQALQIEPVHIPQYLLESDERGAIAATRGLFLLLFATTSLALSFGHGILLAALRRWLFPSIPVAPSTRGSVRRNAGLEYPVRDTQPARDVS